ncbi:glycoside hydrolase superfamily [Dichotomopilus funicola]|uniref:Glycoside hydrolase superfamily n=1 Tax=Dichotomopilus funicola TaxID=1934379 RepID=A0AAN6UXV3_9PEZI|nr:glycoside hydrolase superfamily [Dichotomopilus funicola]
MRIPLNLLLSLLPFTTAAPNAPASNPNTRATWPDGPFTTSGRYILNASNQNLTYAGTNWPGHADVMIPEGLQYQSISSIVDKVKSLGMNAVRLTYAIQMIDEIYDNGGVDISIETAFVQALGQSEGERVLGMVLERNPELTKETTRLEVFDKVVEELGSQEVYVHLDNHISKGMWCCSTDDGNSWWGDRDFDTGRWVRGLGYMAEHGKAWPALVSMGLRNEPREPPSNPSKSTYNWASWHDFMQQGANAVNSANPDVLIFLSGLNFDTFLTPVVQGTALTPGSNTFKPDEFAPGFANKLVLELHNYENSATSCDTLSGNLDRNGFEALDEGKQGVANVMPVMMTEFGFEMDESTWQGVYASCLTEYLPARKAGWTIWVLAGSYYIRSGTWDYEESWGLLSHDWSGWRSEAYVEGALKEMVRRTLS